MSVEGGQSDSRYRRRHRKGDVDQGIDEPATGKPVSDERPSDDKSEDGIEAGGNERSPEGQFEGGDDERRGYDLPKIGEGHRGGNDHKRRKWQQDDQAEIRQRESECQPEAGQNTVLLELWKHFLGVRR